MSLHRPIPLALGLLLIGALAVPPSQAAAQSMPAAMGTSSSAEAAALAGFGGALAIVDGEVIVGEGQNSLRSGLVYVFRRGSDGAWAEALQLAGGDSEVGDRFGTALSADGAHLLVSAPAQDEGRGTAILFERNASGDWVEVTTLRSGAVEAGDGFGASVALAGGWAAVGAPGRGAQQRGAVVLFRRDAQGSWHEHGMLTLEDAEDGDQFGLRVTLGEGLLVASAPGRSQRAGTAYAFRMEGGDWRPAGQLTASGLEQNNQFGVALALLDGRVVVGAPGHLGGSGAAFVFRAGDDAGSWIEERRLMAFDGTRQYVFGAALAVGSGELWIGSPGADQTRGAAYVLHQDGPAFSGVTRLHGHDDQTRGRFGGTVAAAETVAAVGLVGADNQAGTVAIFERSATGEWEESAVVRSEPEALPVIAGATVECGEDGYAAELFSCRSIEILSFLPVPELGGDRGIRLNDIWGWTDPETGKEYALVGRTDGSAFVDITDPNNPVYVGQLYRTEGSPTASWRDIKVYADHAYIVADASGAHGMQVFDLTRLREFAGTPITWEPDLTYDRINSAHNIVINEESGFAYAVGVSGGGETCGGGLHMIDIRAPKSPTFAGCFSDPQTGRASTGYSHDAQCVVYRGPDERYTGQEICLGANETALSIADVTDKENPVAISRASYPNVGYSHQGWLDDEHTYFYMNDELDELQGLVNHTRTIIWDVSRLDDPQVVGEHFSEATSSDHNLYIIGDLMYQSNYASGLRILDISERQNPVEVGHLVTSPYANPGPGFPGSWSNFPFFESGTLAVSSIGEGLYLVRYSPPATVF